MLRAIAEVSDAAESKATNDTLPSTGERFIPGIGGSIELEHLHRYLFAQAACAGKIVLDIACGEGYGSSILAQVAKSVIGVDIAIEAVEHARRRYSASNVRFMAGSCAAIPLNDASVDAVVSFETIEHHDQHEQMLSEIRRVLRPGGILILSSPERFEYSERPGTVNEFHVHELYRAEFVELVERHFLHVDIYDQKVLFGSAILSEDLVTRNTSAQVDALHEKSRGLVRPIYLIAVASDRAPPALDTGIFEQPLAETAEWKWWIDTVGERDAQVHRLDARVGELHAQLERHKVDRARLPELEQRLEQLSDERRRTADHLLDYTTRIVGLQHDLLAAKASLEERQRQLSDATDRNAEAETQLAAVDQQMATMQRSIDEAHMRVAAAERAVIGERMAREEIYRSTSWRVTAPMRAAKDSLALSSRLRRSIARDSVALLQSVYHRLPVTRGMKNGIKNVFFGVFGFAVRRTTLYENWIIFRNRQKGGSTPISQFAAHDTVLTEPATMAPAYSAASVSLWVADGTREWVDLPLLRERLAAARAASLAGVAPRPLASVTIATKDFEAAARALTFPVHAKPLVTILIPVFNHAKLTLECLTSIANARTSVPFEIVVADDASTDETAALLALVQNIKVHTNAQNLNFLRNCNASLPLASGDYVVFLNNDVQVQDRWLDEMLKPFLELKDVGAVGPKIVYPSGHLQEAGVAFNADMTADMIGLNDDPSLAQYNYLRRVDFCSGACLMVPAGLLASLGGFSTDFVPAYCEDSDLCLRIQERGLFVYYAPGATVMHHLSGTTAAVDQEEKLRLVANNLVTLADKWQARVDQKADVRTIAFYLPQFYPFPENDRWWGKGFTEWTNVTKAQPNFVGHYQPHLPADLGYYDLRVARTMEDQANLARRYGLGGFCFYYYWFAGKRLLDLPIERMLETGKPDFPFCLCWANENWTRRWDGQESHVLMAQSHSDEDDEAVILDLIRFLRSPNYIRIDGRPLLIVYRVTLFPDFARTAAHWREVCRREGIGEIHLSMVESFELVHADVHPSQYGCDATIEFPPQELAQQIPASGHVLNPDFAGMTGDYRDLAYRYCTRPAPAYTRFRGVMPGWDNTPRRQDNSFCFEHSTPGAFQAWLEHVMDDTRKRQYGDERIVFINAWNEWAEGAHLEPDRRFGHTYLEALKNAKDHTSLLRMQRYALDG